MACRTFWLAVILFWAAVITQCAEACIPSDEPVVINCVGCR